MVMPPEYTVVPMMTTTTTSDHNSHKEKDLQERRALIPTTSRGNTSTTRGKNNKTTSNGGGGGDDGIFKPLEVDAFIDELQEQKDSNNNRGNQKKGGRSKMTCVVFLVTAIIIIIVFLTRDGGKKLKNLLWMGHRKDYLIPPIAKRMEDNFLQLGVAPSDWDMDVPRQSQESTMPLLDPPVLLPNPYGWLRDDEREDPDVMEYLYAENNYTAFRLDHLSPLTDEIYQELLQYMDETSHSFPVLDRNYFYYQRTKKDLAYPLHCRALRPEMMESPGEYLQTQLAMWDGKADSPILPGEVIYLDENVMAKGESFFSLGSLEVSPSETLLAYTVDTKGNELYQFGVMDIATGETVMKDDFSVLTGDLAWGWDDDTLFFSKPDETQRPYQIYSYSIESQIEQLLFSEPDVTYSVGFGLTMDRRYLLISTSSSESSEMYYVSSEGVSQGSALTPISTRRSNVLYSVEHYKGYWWILSNVNDPDADAQLFTVSVGEEDDDNWTLVQDPWGADVTWLDKIAVESISVFRNHMVIEGRYEGIVDLWIVTTDPDDGSAITKIERVDFPEERAHTTVLGANLDYDTSEVMIAFVSMVSPAQQMQINLFNPNSDDRLTVHQRDIPGYDKDQYGSTRISVPSRDGQTQIPVSLVYRKSTWTKMKDEDQPVPIHLYAYGAYGISMDDSFSSGILPLLHRGMIYAVAHIRGGGDMGRKWYTSGKLLKKENTFNDFVDVGRYLVDESWTTSDLLSCEGRSAGGLTMGASLNQDPSLFRAAILGVPFVDLMATMSDASIPLVRTDV